MTVVAVTGAAGFVGRATCQALLDSGTGVRALVRKAQDGALVPSGATLVPSGDLAAAHDLQRALGGCDAVIHLAGRSSGTLDDLFAANSLTTERVCRAAAQGGVRRVVYVSSVKAVGERTFDRPMDENSSPTPTEPYGRSKLLGEETASRLGRELGLEVVIVRPPMVHGPGVGGNFSSLVTLSRLAARFPLPLGGIENRRSAIFVHNLADALGLLAHHPRVAGETLFVSDGAALSTPELMRTIGAALGIRVRLFAINPRTLLGIASLVRGRGQIDKLCASLEVNDRLLRRLTGWIPPYTFERAIALTVNAAAPLVSPDVRA